MACNPDLVKYIVDQCSDAGEIAVKKMMGDYCVYCDGFLFGLICDNSFYMKVTEPGLGMVAENDGKEGIWRSIWADSELVGSISVERNSDEQRDVKFYRKDNFF